MRRRRRALFARAGAVDEQEFRRVALEATQARRLQDQRNQVAAQISNTLGSQMSEQEVSTYVVGGEEYVSLHFLGATKYAQLERASQ